MRFLGRDSKLRRLYNRYPAATVQSGQPLLRTKRWLRPRGRRLNDHTQQCPRLFSQPELE